MRQPGIISEYCVYLYAGILHLDIFHQAMSAQLKDLVRKLRKIGGVQSFDLGKKRGEGSVSGSGTRDAESSGPVNPSEQAVNDAISLVQTTVEVDAAEDV